MNASLTVDVPTALPNSVEAHSWYADNMGMYGTFTNVLNAGLYVYYIGIHAARAEQLDYRYFQGLPCRLLGKYYQCALPGMFGNQDKNKARVLLERALKLGTVRRQQLCSTSVRFTNSISKDQKSL